MLETKRPWAAGLALALLAATGCYDFDTEFDDCLNDGQCLPSTCDASAVDLPDDLFYDANCDEVDGTPGNAIFVDPNGQDSNAGTPEAPLKRLSVALRLAASQGKAIYLAQGTYDEEDLRMEQPVSIYGGYSGMASGWKRGREYVTRIGGKSTTGFTVSGLMDADVTIQRVHIGSAASTVPGTPSIGLRVMDSSGVRLSHVEVEAGAGAPGQDGASPGPNPQGGADGGMGLDGTAGTPSGGARGASSCGAGSHAGGMGGVGGTFGAAPATGTAGEPGPTDGGGTGGNPGTNKFDYPCDAGLCVCEGQNGGEGLPGEGGTRGKDGSPGDGTGVLEGNTWVAKSGTDGETGTVGKGGGGGGGGGYCEAPTVQCRGGGGGGGGAGGCPGLGAKGGQGGGASIAMLLIRGHVEMQSCTLKTGGGGKGGAGGTGGAGSVGGPGGTGGKGDSKQYTSGTDTYRAISGAGGKGGKGGDGGPGGHGGNGGGGPSVGVWCDSPESSSVTPKGTTFGLKDAGAPGAGPGARGNTGLLTNYHQCPGSP
ncbi:MAG TPA: PE-PGRS family protein [Archangium sp.]|nr:PE-PGRS family protein [Archangium sp.]